MFIPRHFKIYSAFHVLFGALALFLFCSPMEPIAPFERIESSRIRPVGMVISPYPEGAPGDYLSVRAYFAGKPVVRVTDFRLCKGEFDTIGTPISILGPGLALPDSINFAYKLPDTMLDSVVKYLQTSPGYSSEFDPLIEALKTENFGALPDIDSSQAAAVVGFLTNLNLKCRFMFTVSTADGEELKIRKDFMVRYNAKIQRFTELAERLPVNRNPELGPITLFTVTGDTSDFDPSKSDRSYSGRYLQGDPSDSAIVNDTIEIDTGYSYFFGVYTTVVDKYLIPYPVKNDPSRVKDSLVAEKFSCTWFYEQQGGSSSDDDAMTLQRDEHEQRIKLYPPLDLSVSGCTIWVKMNDYLDSKTPRPTGTAQTSVKCVFKYTEAYRRAMGQ
jgi:hypothetical protein